MSDETEYLTVLTERGQVSVPAEIRRRMKLKPGKRLRWQALSSRELRITIDDRMRAPGPEFTRGMALVHNKRQRPRSDQVLNDLRAGESED